LKFVFFRVDGREYTGFLKDGGKVVNMEACYNAYVDKTGRQTLATHANFVDMVAFLKGGEDAIKLAEHLQSFVAESSGHDEELKGPRGEKVIYDETEVKLLAPVMPSKLLLMGGTYSTHSGVSRALGVAHLITPEQLVKEVKDGRAVRRPLCIFYHSSSVIGPDDEVFIPAPFEKASTHHELTLIIGKRGHNIPREKSYDYVIGYTILNDITIRDIFTEEQTKKHGWIGFPEDKAYDTTKPLGPCIVTKDEIHDPHDLNVELKVSGRTIIKGNTGDMTMLWNIPKIVEHVSRIATLEVGDIIALGAPGRLPGETDLLKTGDVVEAIVQGVGVLRNTVKFEVDSDPSYRTCRRAPELALPNDGNQYL